MTPTTTTLRTPAGRTARPEGEARPAATTTISVGGRVVGRIPSRDLETALEAAAHWVAREVRDGRPPGRVEAEAGDGTRSYGITFTLIR